MTSAVVLLTDRQRRLLLRARQSTWANSSECHSIRLGNRTIPGSIRWAAMRQTYESRTSASRHIPPDILLFTTQTNERLAASTPWNIQREKERDRAYRPTVMLQGRRSVSSSHMAIDAQIFSRQKYSTEWRRRISRWKTMRKLANGNRS